MELATVALMLVYISSNGKWSQFSFIHYIYEKILMCTYLFLSVLWMWKRSLPTWQKVSYYAFPPSGDACSDRQLSLNFELWVEIFCVQTCFHMRIPKSCLSVCTQRSVSSLITLIIYINVVSIYQWKGLHKYYNIKTRKFNFFLFQKRLKLNFDLCRRDEITLASSISLLH